MKAFISSVLILVSINLYAQQIISGTISDERGKPLLGANVFIQGTYEGATTGGTGSFRIETRLSGEYILVVRYLGYQQYHEELILGGSEPHVLAIRMKPALTS